MFTPSFPARIGIHVRYTLRNWVDPISHLFTCDYLQLLYVNKRACDVCTSVSVFRLSTKRV